MIAVPPSQGVYVGRDGRADENPAELDAFFGRMREEHFDLAVQLHGGGRYSNPFTLRLGALAAAGARIVLTGAGDEAHLTVAVRAAMHGPAEDTAGRLSMGGLAGLLSRCALVVSNDSGPLHVAGAVGVPTLGIYWCGNAVTAGTLSRTRHRPVLS